MGALSVGTLLSLALEVIKLINWFTTWAREKDLMDRGRDEEIARAHAEGLRKTDEGKRIMADIMAMSDNEVDELLRRLEPPPASGV